MTRVTRIVWFSKSMLGAGLPCNAGQTICCLLHVCVLIKCPWAACCWGVSSRHTVISSWANFTTLHTYCSFFLCIRACRTVNRSSSRALWAIRSSRANITIIHWVISAWSAVSPCWAVNAFTNIYSSQIIIELAMRTWVSLVVTSFSWTEMPSWTKKAVGWNSSCSRWTVKSLRTILTICCSSKTFCGTIGSHITRCFNSCPSSAIVSQRTNGRWWVLLGTSCWAEEPGITVSTSSGSSSTVFPNSTYDRFLVFLGTGVPRWALCTRFLSTKTVVTC